MELLYTRLSPRPPANDYDELGTLLRVFYSEQEEFPQACSGVTGNPTESVPWASKQFTEDDTVRPPSFVSGATNDDPPPQPQSHDPLPKPVSTWPVLQPSLDEAESVGLAVFYREQEEPPPTPPTASVNLLVAAWLPLPFPYDETLEQPTFEDTEALTPAVWPFVWRAITAQDGIDEVPPPVKRFDQEEPYTALVECVPWYTFAVTDEDPGTRLINFYREQEDSAPPCNVESVAWAPVPFLDDEYNGQSGLANVPLDEYRPELPAVEVVAWSAVVSADEDGLSPLANIHAELEEPCITPPVCLPVVQVVAWLPSTFPYDEMGSSLLNAPRGQEDGATLLTAVENLGWAATYSTDDEATGTLAGIHVEVEDAVWPAVTVAYGFGAPAADDEATGSPKNFPREQEEPYVTRVESLLWVPFASLGDEIGASLVVFGLEYDDAASVVPEFVLWLPCPFTDDEFSTRLGNAPLDEFFPPLSPVEMVLWAATFAVDDEAVGAAKGFGFVEEECCATPKDQVQGVVWLPSPALGEEVGSSLAAFGLEDGHDDTRPVETVAWQPRPWTDEDPGSALKGMGVDLEEPYEGCVEAVAWSPIFFRDDETGSSLAGFGRDQEECYNTPADRLQAVSWLLVWPPWFLGWQIDSGVEYTRPLLSVTNFALDFDHVRKFALDF